MTSDRPPRNPPLRVVPEPPPGLFDDDAPVVAEPDSPPRDEPPRDDAPDAQGILLNLPGWKNGTVSSAQGKIKPLESNIVKCLTRYNGWPGTIAFDQFANRLILQKRAPFELKPSAVGYPRPWKDIDTLMTMDWLQCTKGVLIEAHEGATFNALNMIGHMNAFHPVKDYLSSLKWDAVQRLPTLLSAYFGAVDTPYTQAVGTAWMISAIARIMRPGCQADYMLVLEGSQGARKSSALRTLFSDEWFTDARITLNDEGLKKLQGKWGVEIAELEGFRGKAATEIKAFITCRIDQYRASYGRIPEDRPRTCVMAGTTNEREYLVDRTGNRRFWPVMCSTIDLAALTRDRDQLWAEAYARYDSGEQWWLESDNLARDEQRKREVREPWFEMVQAWLADPRRTVPDPTSDGRRSVDITQGFTIADAMTGSLNLRASDMQPGAQTRVGFCLHKLGYTSHKVPPLNPQPDSRPVRERRYFSDESWVAWQIRLNQ